LIVGNMHRPAVDNRSPDDRSTAHRHESANREHEAARTLASVRRRPQVVAFEHGEDSPVGAAELDGAVGDGLEHGLRVGGRGGDDPKHLGCGGLLGPGRSELGLAIAKLGGEPLDLGLKVGDLSGVVGRHARLLMGWKSSSVTVAGPQDVAASSASILPIRRGNSTGLVS
jgi:hypothetical protein